MVYTSYFGNWRKFNSKKIISISLYSPKNFQGEKLAETNEKYFLNIIPSPQLLKNYKDNKINISEYSKIYIDQLNKIDFSIFYKKYDEYILLCYESNSIDKKTGKRYFCHMHILSFYMKKLGYDIEELL